MMLRLILNFSIAAAGLSAGAVRAAEAQAIAAPWPAPNPGAAPAEQAAKLDLRRAVALLDYVATDYGRAVSPQGEILAEDEHREQMGFLREAAQEVRTDAGDAGEELAARIERLLADVVRRAPPAEVSVLARALRDEIAQRFHVVTLPVRPPDLSRGAALYAQACQACHGPLGRAPPKEALGLAAQPTAFAAPEEVRALTPQRIFSATTYGVPGTAMPAFDVGLDEAARWDLAFYVLSLAHAGAKENSRGSSLAQAALLPTAYRELVVMSDDALRSRLAAAGLSPEDSEAAVTALRQGPFADRSATSGQLAQVRKELSEALALARSGDREAARRAVIGAYLDRFEPHEPALRARDGKLVADIEREFLNLRVALDGRGDPPGGSPGARERGDPEAAAARLIALLAQADSRGPGGKLVAFVAALAIALREGLEAALLVAALLALLHKAGRDGDRRAVHFGWASALAAGAVTFWASGALVATSGARRELVEGALQLVTAAILLCASHWLLAAASARKLLSFLSAKTLTAGSALVVFGLSFAAIYREMFEAAVFFRGLLLEAPTAGYAVLGGALLGVICLALLVALFQRVGRRLRPRPLLLACGALLCFLAVLMVGNGVRALQEAGALPLTVWGAFQVPALGLYGTREGLLAQALVLLLLLGSAVVSAFRGGQGKGEKGTAAAAAG